MTELEWSDKPSPKWDRKAQKDFEGKVIPKNTPTHVRLSGPCPRCGHAMTSTAALEIVLGVVESGVDAAEVYRAPDLTSGDRHIDLSCACGETHPKTPDGSAGCGVPFVIHVQWP